MIRPVRPDGKIETGGAFVPIVRRRVIDRIASAAMQRVVLIVAPAGYGKSVAMRQYLDSLTEPHIRYDVLPENGGLLGFLRGFADALAEVAPDARGTLAGAYEKNAGSQSPGADLALWMHSHLRSYRGIVAIDDLHVAQSDREVARFLVSLIERTKGNVQWIIASRATSGLPIGTWLAYGESDLAIDEHDLRFSVEEAKEAARSFRLGVRDEELIELLQLTEGWATAMTFALRSSTRSVDLRNISSMTREMIYRYLAEQVYQTLSQEEQQFIETAALLPEIDLEVMVASGFDRANALIEDLRARVAFINEYEPKRYRLHDLFRDFARHQVELRGSGEQRDRLARLGSILEQKGNVAHALRLYVEFNAPDDALRLLKDHGIRLIDGGFADDLEALTSVSVDEKYEKSPVVSGLRGLLDLSRGRHTEGERKIARSIRLLDVPELRAELTLRLAVNLTVRRTSPVDLICGLLAEPHVSDSLCAEGEALLATWYARAGEPAKAEQLIASVDRRSALLQDDEWLARVALRVGNAFDALGVVDKARQRWTEAAELASRCGLWSVASRSFRNLANTALFAESNPAQSLVFAQQAASAATRAGDYADLQNALISMLSLETRRGNAERAEQIERQLGELASRDVRAQSTYIASSQAHRHAWNGRFSEAQRLFGSIIDRQAHASDQALIRSSYALVLALDGQLKESGSVASATRELLRKKHEPAQRFGALVFDFAQAMLALAEIVAGRHVAAERLLARRLRGGHDAGRAMHDAVEELARVAKGPNYVAQDLDEHLRVIRAAGFGGYARYIEHAAEHMRRLHQPETKISLTSQELSVLRGLASGLNQKQIAAQMGRSAFTVQTHIQNLIEKLGCHGRTEAVSVARAAGLLEEKM
ncbi:MAG TPA: LuxR C-terminal-related transcriptional regulator [Candidatus Acidoferrales bacterium]|nr:LuxR C-terminal-related transcriptional regulator [Candidatus Acidoferrales bacterium]